MPAPERPAGAVIVDTAPIIALSVAGRLDLLRDLYSSVLIPPAVQAEVMAGGASGAGIAELKAAAWVSVAPLTDPRRADLLSDLHRGEAASRRVASEA